MGGVCLGPFYACSRLNQLAKIAQNFSKFGIPSKKGVHVNNTHDKMIRLQTTNIETNVYKNLTSLKYAKTPKPKTK